jgi:WD40 repeat protein
MTGQSNLQLTDALIEKMLVERAGRGAPADLVPSITAAVESAGQRAPGLLGALSGPAASRTRRGPRRTWLLVAATLLVGTGVVGASLIGGRLVVPNPAPTMPVVVTNPTAVPTTPSPSETPAKSDAPSAVPYRAPSSTATGSMTSPRMSGTVTLLPDGRVLVAGGTVQNPSDPMATIAIASAELYDPSTGSWAATGNMVAARSGHTATLLPDGRVLVVGGWSDGGLLSSAELYDPSTGSWAAAGKMSTPHRGHTATLLPDGRVLVAGGATLLPDGRVSVAGGQTSSDGSASAVAELFDTSNGTWSTTGSMVDARQDHTATLLPDGRVLVAGGGHNLPGSPALTSAELYDPSTGSWTATGSMGTPHRGHTATLLPDGRVLVAGGYPSSVSFTFPFPPMASAELYDPSTGSWTATGDMDTPRTGHTATLLPDGRVLVTGGGYEIRSEQDVAGGSATTAEAYDPRTGSWTVAGTTTWDANAALLLPDGRVLLTGSGDVAYLFDPGSGTAPTSASSTPKPSRPPWVAPTPSPAPSGPPGSGWTLTGNMVVARAGQTATVLRDGRVLVVGGAETSAAELYEPVTRTWAATGSMSTPRTGHTATLLPDGRVLVAGGYTLDGNGSFASAELYDPAIGTWTRTGSMLEGRRGHTATLLPDGRVLVAGGAGNSVNWDDLASAELYDPGTGTWTRTGRMTLPRFCHKATLLLNGKVLVTGGNAGEGRPTVGDLYDPGHGTWTAIRKMVGPGLGDSDSATLLPDGRVLVAGGADGTSAQLYDPGTGTWTRTGSMGTPRRNHTATLLPDGTVLVTGGEYQPTRADMIAQLLGESTPRLTSAELYDPASGTWTATSSMLTSRNINDTATLLADGTVLVAGGNDYDMGIVASAELYDPGSR